MLTSLYYGYWDYWELYHKVTFDGPNKLILINDGETSLDCQVDLYSDWKEWMQLEENTKFLPAFTTVGGEPTVEGQALDITYFLINGWRLKPYPGSYDLNINGNLFEVNGGSIKVPADIVSGEPNNISISLNTSVIVRQVTGTSSSGSWDPSTVVTSSLVDLQQQALFDIQDKITEIWTLHGLDISNPLNVTHFERTAGAISQSITTVGTGSSQETAINRI